MRYPAKIRIYTKGPMTSFAASIPCMMGVIKLKVGERFKWYRSADLKFEICCIAAVSQNCILRTCEKWQQILQKHMILRTL